MNVEEIREYCLSKKATTESFPFDEITLVIKVMNKMFILINLDTDLSINLKCDPEKAMALREQYSAVLPGYHMNKKHWNTIMVNGTLPRAIIKQWIDDSYDLVVKSLPKKTQQSLEDL
jgi:predicted DNA-binding protein (MmcQ/YjbR family)